MDKDWPEDEEEVNEAGNEEEDEEAETVAAIGMGMAGGLGRWGMPCGK